MSGIRTFAVVALLSFAGVGCVSNEKYSAAKMEADQYATRLSAVEREKAAAIAERDVLKSQLAAMGGTTDQKDALIVNLTNQINELQNEKADLERRYAKAVSEAGSKTIVLSPELNDALKSFADSNPDLVEFDQNRGIVKFKSDVTFNPGSAVLTANAASAIDRFASILNSPVAGGYELMVVGHTDNVPVHHQATVNAGHKDNWYLSAHRAIAVSNELQKQGVTASRLEVAGFADQRPIASNATEAGKAQNRRVEVLILPTTVHTSGMAATPSPAPPIARTAGSRESARPAEPLNKDANKDMVEVSHKPVFNK